MCARHVTPDRVDITIVGDFQPANPTHRFTNQGLFALPSHPTFRWVGTDEVPEDPAEVLSASGGVLVAPSSPYRDMEGALRAIRFARERGVPLLGT